MKIGSYESRIMQQKTSGISDILQMSLNIPLHYDFLSAGKVTVKTEHIFLKSMTSWLIWYKKFWISTRVLEVLLCPVFSSVICLHKVASLVC